MSTDLNQQRNTEGRAGVSAPRARVAKGTPAPSWLSQAADEHLPPNSDVSDVDEKFWDTPPRYSLTNLPSLVPAPFSYTPSRWHTRGARVLFATISFAVIALLVLEVKALRERVDAPGAARAPSNLASGCSP